MKVHSLGILILLAQIAPASFSQTPNSSPPPPPVLQPQKPESDEVVRITTNLVQVDAVVTDRNGKLVTDLKPEEVEIFEDGRKQKVTHFSFSLTESAPTERMARAAPPDKAAPAIPPSRLRPED